MSRGKTADAMKRRKKRTTLKMNRDNFRERATKNYYDNRFSMAWKAATTEFSNALSGDNQGKHGFSANAVAKKIK